MSQIKVLLLFGGESSEHDVSIMSAKNIYAGIDTSKYDVQLCYIEKNGNHWVLVPSFDDLSGPEILPMLGQGRFWSNEGEREVDVIFPVLHGANGEDGSVQGLAQLLHIPIVGCGIASSALCWNKLLTKQLLASGDMPVVPYVAHRRGEDIPAYSQLAEQLGEVLFVKPATAGSSVGVSRVGSAAEFESAMKAALEHSNVVLIEQAVVGRELEVAVLGTPPNHKVSGVGEIIPGEEFYSYDDKYAEDSQARVVLEAAMSESLTLQLQEIASQAFAALGCTGLARVDFLVSKAGDIYVNEINTLPGFTNISMYPKLWQRSGIGYEELIDTLLSDAM